MVFGSLTAHPTSGPRTPSPLLLPLAAGRVLRLWPLGPTLDHRAYDRSRRGGHGRDPGATLRAERDSLCSTGRHAHEPVRLGQAIDRIGSGDAFAGAVIDGLLRKLSIEKCATQGLAAAVMKHAIAGDRWIGTRAELQEFDPFDAGDVRR